jgi:hypothetical protein
MAKAPVRVAVTGAAGQIGYAAIFRIAAGDMLGKDQPVILQLLEHPSEKPQAALKGVMMELDDCAFPLLAGVIGTGDARVAFKDADYALLIGAKPRGPGMERKDLLMDNAKIFIEQGGALNDVASRNVKVLVVGNPANTNAYIAMKSAKSLPAKNFTAMLRLDHNRAVSQLATRTGKSVNDIEKMIVWGNHSPTMYPDLRFCTVAGQPPPPPSMTMPGTRTTTSPPSASAAPPSSPPAAHLPLLRPQMPRSTTCATGLSAPTASGSPWAFPPMAPTASPRTSSTAFRSPARTVSTSALKAWPSTSTRAR